MQSNTRNIAITMMLMAFASAPEQQEVAQNGEGITASTAPMPDDTTSLASGMSGISGEGSSRRRVNFEGDLPPIQRSPSTSTIGTVMGAPKELSPSLLMQLGFLESSTIKELVKGYVPGMRKPFNVFRRGQVAHHQLTSALYIMRQNPSDIGEDLSAQKSLTEAVRASVIAIRAAILLNMPVVFDGYKFECRPYRNSTLESIFFPLCFDKRVLVLARFMGPADIDIVGMGRTSILLPKDTEVTEWSNQTVSGVLARLIDGSGTLTKADFPFLKQDKHIIDVLTEDMPRLTKFGYTMLVSSMDAKNIGVITNGGLQFIGSADQRYTIFQKEILQSTSHYEVLPNTMVVLKSKDKATSVVQSALIKPYAASGLTFSSCVVLDALHQMIRYVQSQSGSTEDSGFTAPARTTFTKNGFPIIHDAPSENSLHRDNVLDSTLNSSCDQIVPFPTELQATILNVLTDWAGSLVEFVAKLKPGSSE